MSISSLAPLNKPLAGDLLIQQQIVTSTGELTHARSAPGSVNTSMVSCLGYAGAGRLKESRTQGTGKPSAATSYSGLGRSSWGSRRRQQAAHTLPAPPLAHRPLWMGPARARARARAQGSGPDAGCRARAAHLLLPTARGRADGARRPKVSERACDAKQRDAAARLACVMDRPLPSPKTSGAAARVPVSPCEVPVRPPVAGGTSVNFGLTQRPFWLMSNVHHLSSRMSGHAVWLGVTIFGFNLHRNTESLVDCT